MAILANANDGNLIEEFSGPPQLISIAPPNSTQLRDGDGERWERIMQTRLNAIKGDERQYLLLRCWSGDQTVRGRVIELQVPQIWKEVQAGQSCGMKTEYARNAARIAALDVMAQRGNHPWGIQTPVPASPYPVPTQPPPSGTQDTPSDPNYDVQTPTPDVGMPSTPATSTPGTSKTGTVPTTITKKVVAAIGAADPADTDAPATKPTDWGTVIFAGVLLVAIAFVLYKRKG